MSVEHPEGAGPVLADIGEDGLLATIFPLLPGGPGVLVGPGDDTALLSAPHGSVLATTDAMVRGRDWLDEWSTGADVGAKTVAQNLADIAAMGGVPSGLLVTLIADPRTSLAWVRDFTVGLAQAAGAAGVPVVGGDLSSAPQGVSRPLTRITTSRPPKPPALTAATAASRAASFISGATASSRSRMITSASRPRAFSTAFAFDAGM